MTPQQKLKHKILLRAIDLKDIDAIDKPITSANIEAIYDDMSEDWKLQDAINEVRCSGIDTDLESPCSRHYEADAVAAQMPDDSWVGWSYWHGGGKHGEPESIDWIEGAYNLDCKEEEKLVVIRTFSHPVDAIK